MFEPAIGSDRPRVFSEIWHAQVLALADGLIQSGHFSAKAWAETLGAALKEKGEQGAPDDEEVYFSAALTALEKLSARSAGIAADDLAARTQAWRTAYETTPHGQPVILAPK